MYKCTKCGREYEGNFCPDCGEPRARNNFCPNCGAKLEGDCNVCPNCGHNLAAQNESVEDKRKKQNNLARNLSALPIIFIVFTIISLPAFFSANVVKHFNGTLFDNFKEKGFSGLTALNGVAAGIFGLTLALAVIGVALIIVSVKRPLRAATFKTGGIPWRADDILKLVAAVLLLVMLSFSAHGIAEINKADGGIGLFKPDIILIYYLILSLIGFVCITACVFVNQFAIVRKNPSAGENETYLAARAEYAAAIAAPEVKQKPEIYCHAVKLYVYKCAATGFLVVLAGVIVCLVGNILSATVMKDNPYILPCIAAVTVAAGIALTFYGAYRGNKKARARIKDIAAVEKTLKSASAFAAVILLITLSVIFYGLSVFRAENGPFIICAVSEIVGAAVGLIVAVLIFIHIRPLLNALYENTASVDQSNPKNRREIKKLKITQEQFEEQAAMYDEYTVYMRQMLEYNYRAYVYASAKEKNKEADISAVSCEPISKTGLLIFRYGGFMFALCAAALALCAFLIPLIIGLGAHAAQITF